MAKRLTRSRSDRVVAGVAGGLARYFDVDPVLFRIGFVVITLMGGSGLLLYLAGWLLIPEEDEEESVGQRWVHDTDTLKVVLVVAAIVLLIPWVFVSAFAGFGEVDGIAIPLLILGGAVVWMSRDRDSSDRHRGPLVDETQPASPTTTSAAPATPTTPSPPPPAAPPPREPRRPRGPSITRLILSILLVAAGVAALLDQSGAMHIDVMPFLAFGLVVVGAGLAVGWRWGRTRGLIPIGVLLTVVLSVGAASDGVFDAGVGEERHRPLTLAELDDEYRLGIGELVLDLRSLPPFRATHEIEVRVGIGQATVMLPPDVGYDVEASAGIGSVTLLGQEDNGFGAEATATGSGTGLLVIDARSGIGEVTVIGGGRTTRGAR